MSTEVRKSQRGWYARCHQHQFLQPADDWGQALMLALEHASHLHERERMERLLRRRVGRERGDADTVLLVLLGVLSFAMVLGFYAMVAGMLIL